MQMRKILFESAVSKVFEVPSSIPTVYRVEALKPDGTTDVFPSCRAHTSKLKKNKNGTISICVESSGSFDSIPPEYHFLHGGFLYAIKKHNVKNMSRGDEIAFGLNYDLLSLPWRYCYVAHACGPHIRFMFSTRREWENGEILEYGREVQVFHRMSFNQGIWEQDLSVSSCMKVKKWIEGNVIPLLGKGA